MLIEDQDSMWIIFFHSAMVVNCQLSTIGLENGLLGSPRPYTEHPREGREKEMKEGTMGKKSKKGVKE